jgi:hypothetical protein
MLALLFDQYPQYARLASMPRGIIISTFRTALLSKGGLQGEEAWHQDNIAFPGSKNRNLLITWGPGTEALTSANSEIVSAQLELGIQICDKSRKYDTFHKYLPETTVDEQAIPYLKSQSPNGDGNITALIMTGTKVFHRREKIDDESRYGREYRYALNIYYNSADLEEECGGGGGGGGGGAPAPSAPPENNKTGGRRRRTRRRRLN